MRRREVWGRENIALPGFLGGGRCVVGRDPHSGQVRDVSSSSADAEPGTREPVPDVPLPTMTPSTEEADHDHDHDPDHDPDHDHDHDAEPGTREPVPDVPLPTMTPSTEEADHDHDHDPDHDPDHDHDHDAEPGTREPVPDVPLPTMTPSTEEADHDHDHDHDHHHDHNHGRGPVCLVSSAPGSPLGCRGSLSENGLSYCLRDREGVAMRFLVPKRWPVLWSCGDVLGALPGKDVLPGERGAAVRVRRSETGPCVLPGALVGCTLPGPVRRLCVSLRGGLLTRAGGA
ncbi:uncharacterized protein [Oryctolagus cuniculus]|uniref:uncharacterized protein isoform X2 n=1 Tax=Oryctolagus cuniculus TaxID=9986 RepID=UPI0038799974